MKWNILFGVWAEKIIFIRENIKEDKYSIGNLIFNVKDNYV